MSCIIIYITTRLRSCLNGKRVVGQTTTNKHNRAIRPTQVALTGPYGLVLSHVVNPLQLTLKTTYRRSKLWINNIHMSCFDLTTRYVDGTPTSEVTPVTIRWIRPPNHGHPSQYHGHEWTTPVLFVPCQTTVPSLR